MKTKKKKELREYLYIATIVYLVLSPFNLLFAWFGLICFVVPLMISITKGSKAYCNRYCGRGQLLTLLGSKFKLSRSKPMPKWMRHKAFRYGFLLFFLAMFAKMLLNTYFVFQEATNLRQVITLFWTFKLPWTFTSYALVSPWVVQFAFGFYSMMLTSSLLGLITMVLYKPRSWCVYCPMGTMTQGICQIKNQSNTKKKEGCYSYEESKL